MDWKKSLLKCPYYLNIQYYTAPFIQYNPYQNSHLFAEIEKPTNQQTDKKT